MNFFGEIKIATVLMVSLWLVGCATENEETPEPVIPGVQTIQEGATLVDLLITDRGVDFYEAWSCFYESGEPAMYLFFDQGEVTGLENYYMGMEIQLRSPTTPFTYGWRILNESSVALLSPPEDKQDVWTDIRFNLGAEPAPLMEAVSSSRGPLFCSLEGRAS